MKYTALRNATFAIILAISSISCSCEQRLARIERKCGMTLPAKVDTVLTYRDSLHLDTVFDTLTDTLFFQVDSITVLVLRDTVNRKTYVSVQSPPVERSFTVTIPVKVPMAATWENWWTMTKTLATRWNWWLVLLLIAAFVTSILKAFSYRRN